jgi:hypothetical protein
MNDSNASARKANLQSIALVSSLLALGGCSTGAEIFQHAGSTATVEQRGYGTSRSEVIYFEDGQKIVTQDGSNTNITIQRRSGHREPEDLRGTSGWVDDRFDRQVTQQRFRRRLGEGYDLTMAARREALRERMLDRMRNRFQP